MYIDIFFKSNFFDIWPNFAFTTTETKHLRILEIIFPLHILLKVLSSSDDTYLPKTWCVSSTFSKKNNYFHSQKCHLSLLLYELLVKLEFPGLEYKSPLKKATPSLI